MKVSIMPVGKKILIKDKQPSEYFPGTTILKPGIDKEYIADVISIGKDVGEIKSGDIVQYAEHANAIKMQHNGEEHLLISSDMILAILKYE